MTQYEREKTENLIRGMSNEELEIVKQVLREKENKLPEIHGEIVNYEMFIQFNVTHEFNGFENLKSDREYAEGIAQMVADEVVASGGFCFYEILASVVGIKNNK